VVDHSSLASGSEATGATRARVCHGFGGRSLELARALCASVCGRGHRRTQVRAHRKADRSLMRGRADDLQLFAELMRMRSTIMMARPNAICPVPCVCFRACLANTLGSLADAAVMKCRPSFRTAARKSTAALSCVPPSLQHARSLSPHERLPASIPAATSSPLLSSPLLCGTLVGYFRW